MIKKWGNSLGIVIPKEAVEKEELKENDKIKIKIRKEFDYSDVFGTLKMTMPPQKFKDLAREGWK